VYPATSRRADDAGELGFVPNQEQAIATPGQERDPARRRLSGGQPIGRFKDEAQCVGHRLRHLEGTGERAADDGGKAQIQPPDPGGYGSSLRTTVFGKLPLFVARCFSSLRVTQQIHVHRCPPSPRLLRGTPMAYARQQANVGFVV
jgi:hypothetical protein